MREYVANHKISKAERQRATETIRRLEWEIAIDEAKGKV